jgi:hypothetical protein
VCSGARGGSAACEWIAQLWSILQAGCLKKKKQRYNKNGKLVLKMWADWNPYTLQVRM